MEEEVVHAGGINFNFLNNVLSRHSLR